MNCCGPVPEGDRALMQRQNAALPEKFGKTDH